jgi:hypothetical protein
MIHSIADVKTNAALLRIVEPLWFPDFGALTSLDCTYGGGLWWTDHQEPTYVSDIDGDGILVRPIDYRRQPWDDASIDIVFFDPPYAPPGGRETSTIKAMHAAYGQEKMPKTPKATFLDHRRAVMEIGRILAPKGRMVAKCMDFITSGRYWSGLENMTNAAVAAGMRLEDMVVHHSGNGPQPLERMKGGEMRPTEQQHTWRVHSYLLLYVKEAWA